MASNKNENPTGNKGSKTPHINAKKPIGAVNTIHKTIKPKVSSLAILKQKLYFFTLLPQLSQFFIHNYLIKLLTHHSEEQHPFITILLGTHPNRSSNQIHYLQAVTIITCAIPDDRFFVFITIKRSLSNENNKALVSDLAGLRIRSRSLAQSQLKACARVLNKIQL